MKTKAYLAIARSVSYFPSELKTLSVLGEFSAAISTGTRWFTIKDCKSHCFGRTLQHYYSPANWARELFKPPTDSASLLVQNGNFFFHFGWHYNEGMFSPLCPSLPGPTRLIILTPWAIKPGFFVKNIYMYMRHLAPCACFLKYIYVDRDWKCQVLLI